MKPIKYIVAGFAALALSTTAYAQDFEPEYVGGYPTKETAERARFTPFITYPA